MAMKAMSKDEFEKFYNELFSLASGDMQGTPLEVLEKHDIELPEDLKNKLMPLLGTNPRLTKSIEHNCAPCGICMACEMCGNINAASAGASAAHIWHILD
jgi:hypothetical protein